MPTQVPIARGARRRLRPILAAALLAVFGTVCQQVASGRALCESATENGVQEEPAAEGEKKPQGDRELIGEAMMQRRTDIRLIGSLLNSNMSKGELELTEEQKRVISKLNHLLCEARYQRRLVDAAAVPANEAARAEFLGRSWERQLEAIRHGIRLVSLGVLTEEQAAFVTQRDLDLNGLSSLYADKNVVEILGLDRNQIAQLDRARERATANGQSLMGLAFRSDEKAVKEYQKRVSDQKRDNDGAVKEILTPAQLEKWAELTTPRPAPAIAAALTRLELSAAETASVHVVDLSPVFRAVAGKANALGLSGEQKIFVKDLEEVTRTGYGWIGRGGVGRLSARGDAGKGRDDRIARVRSEFLKRAELILLLGILSERQAEQVKTAVDGRGTGGALRKRL